MYHLHYTTDSPLNIQSLLYVPSTHMEKFGFGKSESAVSLFSRKVLIQSKAKGLFPDWLRFLKGVVDSADVPLNVSREHLQDSAVIKKLSNSLVRRVLKFLADELQSDREKYDKFWNEFGNFIKEGICTDFAWRQELGKLLRFESSETSEKQFTSLDEYISRMKEGQQEIYYLSSPSRQTADSSPYFEHFKKTGTEVLFLYTNLDEYVMTTLSQYNGKKLKTVESAKIDVKPSTEHSDVVNKEFTHWLKDVLQDVVSTVKVTGRMTASPAIIVEHESAASRRMMSFMSPEYIPKLPKQILEINPTHPVIIKLATIYNQQASLAQDVAHQIFNNALIAAGLVDDARSMLPRLNTLIDLALNSVSVPQEKSEQQPPESASH